MGSAKVSNVKPQLPMDNKPVKIAFFSTIKSLFKDKKKEKAKNERETEKSKPKDVIPKEISKSECTVATVLETLKSLEIKDKQKQIEREKLREEKNKETEEEDFSDFTFKVIEDDRKRHSSEDSGFTEPKEYGQTLSYVKQEQEVTESFNKLKIEDGERKKEDGEKNKEDGKGKKEDGGINKEDGSKKSSKGDEKKTQKIWLIRRPDKLKCNYKVRPYAVGQRESDKFRQINKHALSGGQVIVNANPPPDNYNEVDIALKQFEKTSQTSINQSEYWQDVLDLIREDSHKHEDFLKDYILKENYESTEDFLNDFKEFVAKEQSIEMCVVPNAVPDPVTVPNVLEEFSASQNLPNHEESIDFNGSILNFENVGEGYTKIDHVFPTPPRSENVPSPMSESQAFYTHSWDTSLSPERSSPTYTSDYEKYQEIIPCELSPVSEGKQEKKRERTSSVSSMTMKNFKDMQKEISNEYSKKDCCQLSRKGCKELFDEHMGKLKAIEKKNLCFKVSKMDLKTAYGVLHHVLLSLSEGSEQEDLQYSLFVLICQRVLAQTPSLFIGDLGLSLLKSAVMRCPQKPLLTRFIVHYVYAALRQESTAAAQECVFHEVDAQGDNLIIACARGGDNYALVLSEITRADVRGDMPPLFRVHHANADGYTALHVACTQHSLTSPRLHTQHVLLEHANADVWKGDIKGGDTALHLAVNSVNCDLRVIMMIFKQLDRKLWKKLAHCQNLSSVTPLEYARSATKSSTRTNYPHEVLDFLKKCR